MLVIWIVASLAMRGEVMPGLDYTVNGVTKHVYTSEFDRNVEEERLILIENGGTEDEVLIYDIYQEEIKAKYLQVK
tara:strand:- start:1481 stop:1708 length:228 start_codon:yes stop_codon:yes gene_type:complete